METTLEGVGTVGDAGSNLKAGEQLSLPDSRISVSGEQVSAACVLNEGMQSNAFPPAAESKSAVDVEKQSCRETIFLRRSLGSTPFNERFDHRSQDYSKTVEHYHVIPPINDYPYQARNPALQQPNPVSPARLKRGWRLS